MNKKLGYLALGVVFLGAPAFADSHGGGEDLYADKCANCHFEDDFTGESADAIAGMINDIKAGKVEHKTDLADLSEEDVKKLADYFASQ